MKKLFCMILTFAVVTLAACGGKSAKTEEPDTHSESTSKISDSAVGSNISDSNETYLSALVLETEASLSVPETECQQLYSTLAALTDEMHFELDRLFAVAKVDNDYESYECYRQVVQEFLNNPYTNYHDTASLEAIYDRMNQNNTEMHNQADLLAKEADCAIIVVGDISYDYIY